MHKVIIFNLYNWVRLQVKELGDMKAREADAEGVQLSDYLRFLNLRNTLRTLCV